MLFSPLIFLSFFVKAKRELFYFFGETTHKQRRCNLALWGILHTWCYNLWLFKKKISKSVGKGLSKVRICGKYYEKLRLMSFRSQNACICHQIKGDDKMKAHWRGCVILRRIVTAELFFHILFLTKYFQTSNCFLYRFFDEFSKYLNVYIRPSKIN